MVDKSNIHQITTKLPSESVEMIKDFIDENPDLELTYRNPTSQELQIIGANMGKHTFYRKIVILLARSLYQPKPAEYDTRKDLY